MRIALVSMHTSPAAVPGSGDAGGMNVVVREAAFALAARGHEVSVVTRASVSVPPGERPLLAAQSSPGEAIPSCEGQRGPHRPREREHGERQPRLVALRAGELELQKAELPAVVPEFAAGLAALGEFDAVHAHYWLSGVAAQSAGAARSPIVTTFHTLAAQKNARLAPGDTPEPEARVAAERRLAQSSVVVAVSTSELAAVTEYCGTPERGGIVVPPGVDTELFRPAAGAALPHRITVLGRVQPLKGQDLALQAAAALAAADPALFATTEWVIAGEPTPGAEAFAAGLRTAAARAGIRERVRFLPAQTRAEAASLLASSTLVLVPSHSETFGLTALEAAASGVPVIAGGHTGLLEAVPDRVAGVHVAGRNPRDWAARIAELLRDEPRRAALARSARQHAQRHDWRAHAAALERVYAGLRD